ncbi:MAG TPA: zinc-finger-containing protein [Chitinophagaceae bacterium]|nr:MAG: hypothetical protein UZ11_BCD004002083 [Bacteroidetes bacterium OLB11]HMN32143.1 zinc-finger-containing protein [Chitinophagaceae bacterium]
MNNFEDIISGKICPYCNCETELVSSKEIYGPDSTYGSNHYRCKKNPDHYVGTYKNSTPPNKSLGRLADKELREWKMKGHGEFDPLHKAPNPHFENSKSAYQWLSKEMNIEINYTHFGMFTIEQCQQAIALCQQLKKNQNTKNSTSE